MKYIDLANWKRREHYEFFRRMDYPQYNVCMDVDVTHFLQFVRDNGLSFYYAMNFAVAKATDEVENFRYRIREDGVILHDHLHPSFTDIGKNDKDGLFKFITAEIRGDIFEFNKRVREISDTQTEYFPFENFVNRDDLIYTTCLPWISFTSLSHPISINNKDAVPRISWGKYFPKGDNVMMPLSVQVHHALVDGLHIARYVEALQTLLDGFE